MSADVVRGSAVGVMSMLEELEDDRPPVGPVVVGIMALIIFCCCCLLPMRVIRRRKRK